MIVWYFVKKFQEELAITFLLSSNFETVEYFASEDPPARRLIRGFIFSDFPFFFHFSSGTLPFLLVLIVLFLRSDILNISFSNPRLNVLSFASKIKSAFFSFYFANTLCDLSLSLLSIYLIIERMYITKFFKNPLQFCIGKYNWQKIVKNYSIKFFFKYYYINTNFLIL